MNRGLNSSGLHEDSSAVRLESVDGARPPKTNRDQALWFAKPWSRPGSTVAVDFFAVPTLTCQILFVFVVLAHDRRRILHVNVTQHPTSVWARQQLREAFPDDATARFLLLDRDTTFDAAVGRAVQGFGLTSVRTAPRSSWQNPYVERVIGSIRRGVWTSWPGPKSAGSITATNGKPPDPARIHRACDRSLGLEVCLQARPTASSGRVGP